MKRARLPNPLLRKDGEMTDPTLVVRESTTEGEGTRTEVVMIETAVGVIGVVIPLVMVVMIAVEVVVVVMMTAEEVEAGVTWATALTTDVVQRRTTAHTETTGTAVTTGTTGHMVIGHEGSRDGVERASLAAGGSKAGEVTKEDGATKVTGTRATGGINRAIKATGAVGSGAITVEIRVDGVSRTRATGDNKVTTTTTSNRGTVTMAVAVAAAAAVAAATRAGAPVEVITAVVTVIGGSKPNNKIFLQCCDWSYCSCMV